MVGYLDNYKYRGDALDTFKVAAKSEPEAVIQFLGSWLYAVEDLQSGLATDILKAAITTNPTKDEWDSLEEGYKKFIDINDLKKEFNFSTLQ